MAQESAETILESLDTEIEDLEKFEINPNFYAHITIIQILKAPHMAFINGNKDAGLTSLIFGVDQLERIVKAEKMLPEDYDKKIKEDPSYPKTDPKVMQSVDLAMIANIKFQFLLKEVFAHRMKRIDAII